MDAQEREKRSPVRELFGCSNTVVLRGLHRPISIELGSSIAVEIDWCPKIVDARRLTDSNVKTKED
jgi:hypothetical protein